MSHEKQCLLQDNEAERTKLLIQKPVPFKYEGTIRVFQVNKTGNLSALLFTRNVEKILQAEVL